MAKSLDKSQVIGMILMDLSKAYDCLPHDLIIAKLEAYGFGKESLCLLRNFLTNRKQRVKIGSKFSEWLDILLGVPQGSILGPIIFNIFINDIFLFVLESEVCNFADDNTIYACENSLDDVISHLKNDIARVTKWYQVNSLVANPAKFQMMFLGHDTKQPINIEIDGINIQSADCVKLLGVFIDKKLSFNEHISNLCKSGNNKINALLRIRQYIDNDKARALCNAYIMSLFNYCSLIWMFCNKKCNDKIDRTHKRAFRTVYNRTDLSLENY